MPLGCVSCAHEQVPVTLRGIFLSRDKTGFADCNTLTWLPDISNASCDVHVNYCIETPGRVSSSEGVIIGPRDETIIAASHFTRYLTEYYRELQFIGACLGVDLEPGKLSVESFLWVADIQLRVHVGKDSECVGICDECIEIDAAILTFEPV